MSIIHGPYPLQCPRLFYLGYGPTSDFSQIPFSTRKQSVCCLQFDFDTIHKTFHVSRYCHLVPLEGVVHWELDSMFPQVFILSLSLPSLQIREGRDKFPSLRILCLIRTQDPFLLRVIYSLRLSFCDSSRVFCSCVPIFSVPGVYTQKYNVRSPSVTPQIRPHSTIVTVTLAVHTRRQGSDEKTRVFSRRRLPRSATLSTRFQTLVSDNGRTPYSPLTRRGPYVITQWNDGVLLLRLWTR